MADRVNGEQPAVVGCWTRAGGAQTSVHMDRRARSGGVAGFNRHARRVADFAREIGLAAVYSWERLVPMMSLAPMTRFASQRSGDKASPLHSILHKGFGGHAVREEILRSAPAPRAPAAGSTLHKITESFLDR